MAGAAWAGDATMVTVGVNLVAEATAVAGAAEGKLAVVACFEF